MLKKLICAALAVCLLMGSALAEVVTTASVNLRDDASLSGNILYSVGPDTHLEFMGNMLMDERPVLWYQVKYKGTVCWVSSAYSELVGQIGNGVELSSYYHANLFDAAKELQLPDYIENEYSELPYEYANPAVSLFGCDTVEGINLHDSGYTLFNAYVDMDIYTVATMYMYRGLDLNYTYENCYIFEHKGTPPGGEGEYDSCIIVSFDGEGKVYDFEWSTYTG